MIPQLYALQQGSKHIPTVPTLIEVQTGDFLLIRTKVSA